jgi:sporulation protein YlmC with PRC-barrel domain
MRKFMTTAALVALMAAAGPLAYAQTMSPTQAHPPAERSTTAPHGAAPRDDFTTGSGQLRASEMIGSTVYDEQNQNIGSVKDMLLDRNGRVQLVVLDVGSFLGAGGKYVTVSMNEIKTDNNRLTLNKTKDQLQAAPAFHFKTP